MEKNGVAIEYMPLSEIAGAPRNAKDHSIDEIWRSIARFGFVDTPVMDERTERLVAGHGRLDALRQMKVGGQSAPERITEEGGEWYVPVLRGVHFRSDEDAEAYLIGANRLTELGGWDDNALAGILKDLSEADALEGVGFDSDDLDSLLASLDGEGLGGNTDPDDVPEEPVEPVTRRGELWCLGEHRLVCGDATCGEDVGRLIADGAPMLCVTDPPYGVSYDPAWRSRAAEEGKLAYAASRVGDVTADDRADWSDAWRLFPGDVIYSWHPPGATSLVHGHALEAAGFALRMQIIWAKSNFPIGRGDYHVRHEPCWYAVREGKAAHRNSDRTQTTLWEINLDRNVEGGHSTQKPVECMARPIRNHEISEVYDPFCGSGTTIIAAEQLQRRCFALEIEPRYCDVILQRYADYTGDDPVREDGTQWSELSAANKSDTPA